MAAQAAHTSRGPDNFHLNLAEKLQLPASFCGYLAEKVDGKCLDSFLVKEKSKGDITVILTFHVVENKELGRHIESRSNADKTSLKPGTPSPTKKKKSPSRL